jgi:hypothetical protein
MIRLASVLHRNEVKMKTINKYGIEIRLPGGKDTRPERLIESTLRELGLNYQMQFFFDEAGLRRKKFDAAVFASDGEPALLIEYDGAEHYDADFFKSMGNRPERNKAHVVKVNLGDAEKARIALDKGIPLLRINSLQERSVRDLILSYVWTFIDNSNEQAKEISMVKMLDKYGWDFDYVQPSTLTKAEESFLKDRGV